MESYCRNQFTLVMQQLRGEGSAVHFSQVIDELAASFLALPHFKHPTGPSSAGTPEHSQAMKTGRKVRDGA